MIHFEIGRERQFPVTFSGGVYGDAVSGLFGGVLSLADQDRSVTRGEPGQRVVEDHAVEVGAADHLVESCLVPLRAA